MLVLAVFAVFFGLAFLIRRSKRRKPQDLGSEYIRKVTTYQDTHERG